MIKNKILKKFNINESEICNQLDPKSHEIVFLSGSQFDGLGNERSDLDIYLVTNDFHPLLQNEKTIDQNIIIGNKRFDLSIFSISLILETAQYLNALDFSNPNVYVPRQIHPQVSNYEICTMIHRLKVGSPIYNHEKYNQILEDFPFASYIKWQIRIKLNEYDGLYEDLIGSLESDDYLTAEELIQQKLRLISQILILSAGETFDRDKWVPRKISQLQEREFFSEDFFREFQEIKKSLVYGKRDEIMRAIKFCEQKIEAIQLQNI